MRARRRTLQIVVVVAVAGLAWFIAREMRDAQLKRDAYAVVFELGGRVYRVVGRETLKD